MTRGSCSSRVLKRNYSSPSRPLLHIESYDVQELSRRPNWPRPAAGPGPIRVFSTAGGSGCRRLAAVFTAGLPTHLAFCSPVSDPAVRRSPLREADLPPRHVAAAVLNDLFSASNEVDQTCPGQFRLDQAWHSEEPYALDPGTRIFGILVVSWWHGPWIKWRAEDLRSELRQDSGPAPNSGSLGGMITGTQGTRPLIRELAAFTAGPPSGGLTA